MNSRLLPPLLGSILCLLAFTQSHAAPDMVDIGFANTAGQVFTPNAYGGVSSVMIQPDGKILFGSNEMPGTVATVPLQLPLTRFNPDGSVDNTFFADNDPNGSGTGIYYDAAGWPEVHALGLLSDGKIVAAGVMQGVRTDMTGNPGTFLQSNSIVRFNADGTLDTTFQTAGTTAWPTGGLNYIEEVTIQPDDKTIAVGGFGGFRDTGAGPIITRYGIARLNLNGSIDTSFAIKPAEFGVPAGVSALRGYFSQSALDPSGKIYVVGYFEWGFSFPAPKVHAVARLFPDGSRDYAFNPTLPGNLDEAHGIVVEPDGKVVVLGRLQNPATTSWMVRLNPDGSVAPSFTLAPSLGIVTARPLQRDPSGKYLLATASNQDRLVRVLANGSLDATFDATSLWTNHPTTNPEAGYFGNFTTAPTGKIYSGSAFDSVEGVPTVKVVAFDGDALAAGIAWASSVPSVAENSGSVSLSVVRTGPLGGAASVSYATSNGSAGASDFAATSGSLNWPAGTGGAKTITIPINQDALNEGNESFTVTLSSASGASITGSAAVSVTIIDDEAPPVIVTQPSSLTVKEGQPATLSVVVSSPVPATYQWFKEGVIMPGKTSAILSFANVVLADDADYSVEVSTGGTPITSSAATLTVIPPATTLAAGYNPAITESNAPVAFTSDGFVLAVNGNFTTGYTVQKFDAAGTLVATWPTITTNATVGGLTLTPLPTGKFLASGFFTQINGFTRHRIARFNANGTLDTTFDTGLTNLGNFSGPVVTSTGAVYISYRPNSGSGGLRRLLDNGTPDPAFTSTLTDGTNGYLWSLAELPDGSLLVGNVTGSFSFTRGLAKLTSTGAAFPGFTALTSLFPEPQFIVPLPDGRFAVARNTILEIRKADGTVDPAFTLAGSFSGSITGLALQRGRLVISGPTTFNSLSIPGLARFSLTGQFDDNFPGGSGPVGGVATSFGTVGDSSLIVRGTFTSWNGVSRNRIAKLDLAFNEVAFELPAVAISENGGPATAQLIRYGSYNGTASVRVTSTNGSAASPADYLAVDQIVNWADGDGAPKTVTLTPVDNAAQDGTRSFSLSLSQGINLIPVVGGMTVSIRDDESLPQITSQPANALVVNGTTATFSVTATSPTAISYQWFFNGTAIGGATSSTYQISSALPANEGLYTVRLTNAYDSVVSTAARLTVVPQPAAISSGFTPLASNIFNNGILALATAPDGGVYAGGAFTSVAGVVTRNRIAKIGPNGGLDTGFTPPDISNNEVRTIAVQADGKILVGGTFTTVDSVTRNRIIRLEANGTLDTAFSTVIGTAANDSVNSIIVEPNGNILVGGSISAWNGVSIGNRGIVRLSPTGAYLGTTNTTTTVEVQDLTRLANGSVLMSYNTTTSSAFKVRRLFSDLTDDASFFYASGRTRVENMDIAADGDYLFAGNSGLFKVSPDGATVTQWSGSQHYDVVRQHNAKVLGGCLNNLSRYLANGTTDSSFVVTSQPDSIVKRFAMRGDGRVWVGGLFTNYNGTAVNKLFLLNADLLPIGITKQPAAVSLPEPGSNLTLSVEAAGISAISYQWFKGGQPLAGKTSASLLLQNVTTADNGSYTCSATNLQGSATSQAAQVIVLDAPEIITQPTGPLTMLEGGAISLTVQARGAATLGYQWYRGATLLSGQTSSTLHIPSAVSSDTGNYTVTVTNTRGSVTSNAVSVTVLANEAVIAPGFTSLTINGQIRAIHPLSGGRVLVGGDFTSISDGVTTLTNSRLAVVNPNGTLENIPGLAANNAVHRLRDGGSGKILVAGNFSTIHGQTRYRVARLNADLALDGGFDATASVTSSAGLANDVAVESSGTILLAGSNYLLRLSNTGALDGGLTTSFAAAVHRIIPQADGKIIAMGAFSSPALAIVRLNSNGSHDNSITYSTPWPVNENTEAVDLGGGSFLTGANWFGFYGGVKLYLANGTTDANFLSQGNAVSNALARDAQGRFLIGGNFASIAGASRNRLVRLTAAGQRDDNFLIGTGFDQLVDDILVHPDGSIWVGGNFTSYNGTNVQRLVRLKGSSGSQSDPFVAFVAALPANLRGENDDADGDGIVNLIEFLFGTAPGNSASKPALLSTGTASSGASLNAAYGLSLDTAKTYRFVEVEIPVDLMGLDVGLEASQNLSFSGDATATQVGIPTINGGTQTRRYLITPAIEDASSLFWRLSVTR